MHPDRFLARTHDGTPLLWRGTYAGARRLLDALKRRLGHPDLAGLSAGDAFRAHRRSRAERARVLSTLLVPLDADHRIALRGAPDVRRACAEAFGPPTADRVLPLTELLGAVGASEWRRRGVAVPALGARIHPHYGVFAPTRRDYVDLVAGAIGTGAIGTAAIGTGAIGTAAIGTGAIGTGAIGTGAIGTAAGPVRSAFDIGTGTGVLAAVLARRGVSAVVGTDINPAAVECARENLARLGCRGAAVTLTDLFPPGLADLVVANPPWLPEHPTSPLEQGVFDADGRVLAHLVAGLPAHLTDGGEAWIVLSDLAELLGLRGRDELLDRFAAAGLAVRGRLDAPRRRAGAVRDALAAARAAETVSLWRLGRRR